MRYCLMLLLAASAAASAQNSPDDVLVSRGGISVTLRDVDAFVARVPKEQRSKFIDSPARIRDMLNNMMLTKQLAAQAREAHLDQDPMVATQLRAAEDEVLARARMTDFTNNIKVPDLKALVAEEYATHKEVYRIPAGVDVRHVLISTELHSDEEAKALAEKVRAEAVANPKGFELLVDKYSEDNSKSSNRGLMRDATSTTYVEEFRNAAAALKKVGEVSPVVHTNFGYHVLELVENRPERQQTLDEVREKLTASMREQYVTNQRRDFINAFNSQTVDINSATLDTLRDRYDDNGNVRVVATPAAKPAGTPPASPPPTH